MKRKWKVFVLHNNHTDIGYTDTQEKIGQYHVDFIKEVVDLINDSQNDGFKWVCESLWCVERFLRVAEKKYVDDFIRHVKDGRIGISGNYLNLTELVGYDVLKEVTKDALTLLKSRGISVSCGMTADVNGFAWGYADALAECGIDNFMTCIHTHHGYHPLFKKQMPFYWQSPKGNKVLVWNGEHYLVGNELGIAQASEFMYTIQDGLGYEAIEPYLKAEMRIRAYLDVLENQGYEYDFVPVCVSGNMTDNSPPSIKVLEFIKKYNEKHGDEIELVMSTLDEFFDTLRNSAAEIPVYSGDWADWWADGAGSTPEVVKHYREASRRYEIARLSDENNEVGDLLNKAKYNLMFYAEHTWGYSSSITEPWHPQVNTLDQWKKLYALKANEYATSAYNRLSYSFGERQPSINRELKFGAYNPHSVTVKDMLIIDAEHLNGHKYFDIVDEETGENVPYQLSTYSRGIEFCLLLQLKPKQKRSYKIVEKARPALTSSGTFARVPIEGVADLNRFFEEDLRNKGDYVSQFGLENRYFKIAYEAGKGITEFIDKKSGRSIVRNDGDYPPFTPIYEVTSIKPENTPLYERRKMGRNRKAVSAKRFEGELTDIQVIENGDLFSRVELTYSLEGTEYCSVLLTAFKHYPKIDADLRLHKKSVWQPENLYLAIPFTTGASGEELWIEKTGCLLRPRIDQIPGSCVDFYSLQSGLAYIASDKVLAVAMPDTPLIAMGDIKAHPIRLMGENGVDNNAPVYSWVMNNFWETNFKADLGGFYQFKYSVLIMDGESPEDCFEKIRAVNMGVFNFRK